MVHMVAPSQDLEEASDGSEGEVVRRGHVRSPHDEMQAYLNVTKGLKWGIVTNGILLRILREYFHTTTKGYVEFDLRKHLSRKKLYRLPSDVPYSTCQQIHPRRRTFSLGVSEPVEGQPPNLGFIHDRHEMLGPVTVTTDDSEVYPFYGVAQLPMKVSHDTVKNISSP